MVAALWANPNWDDTKENKGSRKKMIESANEDFEETVKFVESKFSARPVEEDEEKLSDNPFFAAAERGLSKVDDYIDKQSKSNKPVRIQESKEDDYMKDVDQG